MTESVLFHIKNLKCAYGDKSKVVLNIKELIIPRGKIVFILGSSGSGKSTLLETLGLMNNTSKSGEILFNSIDKGNSNLINLGKIWNTGDEQLNSIRKDNFSFIFQQTNLMENFTAYENISLSEMIKDDVKLEETISKAKVLMNRVGLNENEVDINKMPTFLSGGQRQRLSFVRALCNKSNVVFCDEPTGNLDETNANELFEVIREETIKGRSAVIVSHDINLALKHADLIIVLTKNIEKKYGELLLDNIFERETWEKKNEIETLQFKNKIKELFSTTESSSKNPDKENAKTLLNFNFAHLFRKRESSSLNGKTARNFFIITSILVFTFIAIGFANGSLNYMAEKMNSAFVNLVTFPVPADKVGTKTDELIDKLDNITRKKQYAYTSVSPFVSTGESTFSFKLNSFTKKIDTNFTKSAKIRTIDLATDSNFIKEEILSDKNFLRGSRKGFKSNNEFSVIVSKKFLDDFGYPSDCDFIYFSYVTTDTSLNQNKTIYQQFPMAISAVVNELPGKYYMLYPIGTWAALDNDKEKKQFSYFSEFRKVRFFYKSNKQEDILSFQKELSILLKSELGSKLYSLNFKNDTLGYSNGAMFDIVRSEEALKYTSLDSLWKKISNSSLFNKNKKLITHIPVYQFPDYEFNSTYQQIAIYFEKLDLIEDFDNEFLRKENEKGEEQTDNFQIDMSKVKEKKNYLFLSKVAIITSFFLVFFSTSAISLFVYFLLSAHLNKVKMNIGTFLAIGLSAKKVRRIYFSIILKFILSALIISAALSFVLGELINFIIKTNVKTDDGMKYFVFFDWITAATFFIVLIISLIVSRFTIRNILFKSPGDLVYNR
jgi:lipoprotein-releasing system ATP-binding protein